MLTESKPRGDAALGTASLTALVGNTPLVRLRSYEPSAGIEIHAKLESQNPGGSVKDRAALAMIEDGERRGLLAPGRVLLDATSGNTGIAYAMLAAARGLQVKLCIPANVTPERKRLLTALGADLVLTDPMEGSDGAIREARRLYECDRERYFYPDQYSNAANWRAHYDTTGVEIIEQTAGRLTHFVAGLGTGGTLTGAGRRLKEHNPGVQVIAAEPQLGDLVYGLRSLDDGFIPPIFDQDVLDGKFLVDSADALRASRELLDREGIFAGLSSGAVVHVGRRIAERLDTGDVVCLLADGGWKYLSTHAWDRDAEQAEKNVERTLWW